jgi:hypothetical protein
MKAKASKELVRSTAVVIGAWLIVIAAGVNGHVEDSAAIVRVNYQIE